MAEKEDLAKLTQLAAILSMTAALKGVLTEVLAVSAKVKTWTNVTTSGSAVAMYDTTTHEPSEYEVRYQFGDLGNLVHELTHVAVNEAYGQDFVNYDNANALVAAPVYDAKGRRTNEMLRQTKWMTDDGNKRMGVDLSTLTLELGKAGLPTDKTQQITAKLNYGQINPHTEHDTVLNQILVWLHQWGYPVKVLGPTKTGAKPPPANAFFTAVEAAVTKATNARRAAAG